MLTSSVVEARAVVVALASTVELPVGEAIVVEASVFDPEVGEAVVEAVVPTVVDPVVGGDVVEAVVLPVFDADVVLGEPITVPVVVDAAEVVEAEVPLAVVAPEVVEAVVPLTVAPDVVVAEALVALVVFAEPIAAEEATKMQNRRVRELMAPMAKLRGSPRSSKCALLIHY